ncbi:MAG: hypothetical protein AAB229_07730 [Candidatus Hydrogenedentota bacterium]
MDQRRRHGKNRSKGKRFCIYLPGYIVDRLEDFQKRFRFKPPVSRLVAESLEKMLKSEERRETRK